MKVVGEPEASERLVVIAPTGAPYEGIGLTVVTLADIFHELEQANVLAFPQFHGQQSMVEEGLLRVVEGNRFGVGLDGSIAVRRRLSLDRAGYGKVVSRGDVGICTCIEQVFASILLARILQTRTGRSVETWWVRHELHGIAGRHLMDDPPRERRTGGVWQRSDASQRQNIVTCGAVVLSADKQEIAEFLNDLATEVAVSFGVHRAVRLMRVGEAVLDCLRAT